MKEWLRERQEIELQLQARAQLTRSQPDIDAWERYVRQTARMRVTAAKLRAALPQEFAVENGLRVFFRGSEIYLEHLVVGPTGIYLVETVEDSREWRGDLSLSLEFFRQNLGSNMRYFACLVVARDAVGIDRLPQGAHLLDSLDAAIHVIRDTPAPEPLPRAVSEELWHILRSMAPLGPGQAPVSARVPEPAPASPRWVAWRKWVTIACVAGIVVQIALVAATVNAFFVSLIFFVGPIAVLAGLTRLVRNDDVRQGCSVWVMWFAVFVLLFVLILAAMVSMETRVSDPPWPAQPRVGRIQWVHD